MQDIEEGEMVDPAGAGKDGCVVQACACGQSTRQEVQASIGKDVQLQVLQGALRWRSRPNVGDDVYASFSLPSAASLACSQTAVVFSFQFVEV